MNIIRENLKGQIDVPLGLNTLHLIENYLKEEHNVHPRVIELLKIKQAPQRSDEWFAARKDKLTGSIIDSILGRNKYKSYTDTLMGKLGVGEKFTGNVATRHGEKYEDEAIDLFCEKMGFTNLNFGLLPHDNIGYLSGSPDGITCCGKVLEVKCPYWRKIDVGKVPEHYLSQIKINMEIADLDVGYFIEYAPTEITKTDDYTLNIVKIEREKDWLSSIKPTLDKFYKEYTLYKTIGIQNHPEYHKYKYSKPICRSVPEEYEDFFRDHIKSIELFDPSVEEAEEEDTASVASIEDFDDALTQKHSPVGGKSILIKADEVSSVKSDDTYSYNSFLVRDDPPLDDTTRSILEEIMKMADDIAKNPFSDVKCSDLYVIENKLEEEKKEDKYMSDEDSDYVYETDEDDSFNEEEFEPIVERQTKRQKLK